MNSPFFTSYYDDYNIRHYYSPQSHPQRMRQQAYEEELKRRRATEEARRSCAATMRQRWAYQEELVRLQQQEEAEQVRLLVQERQMERRRRLQHEREIRGRASPSPSQHRRHAAEPSHYQIMRGPDGRLYNIAVEPQYKEPVLPAKVQTQEILPDSIVLENPAFRSETDEKKVTTNDFDPTPVGSLSEKIPNVKMTEDIAPKKEAKAFRKPRRRRVTVVVEDASGSEYEDADKEAVWRNRRPSLGQWMEPV